MKLYIASKFSNYEAVRAAQKQSIAAGHSITYDWTKHVDIGENDMVQCAVSDLEGVEHCDILILYSVPNMQGAWLEMGYALAIGTPVVIVGEIVQPTVFSHHPLVRCVDSIDYTKLAEYTA